MRYNIHNVEIMPAHTGFPVRRGKPGAEKSLHSSEPAVTAARITKYNRRGKLCIT